MVAILDFGKIAIFTPNMISTPKKHCVFDALHLKIQ